MTNDSKTTDECYELAATLNDAVEVFYEPFDGYESTRIAAKILAAGYRKPRTITTAEELDAAIEQSFGQGENLILFDGWRPWIIWENDQGDIRVSSLPVEDDPDSLGLSDIPLPATVLYEPEAEAAQ